ncbi:Structural maintenance of chromosomes protein 5, partial [Xenoophorus captivus]
MNNMMNAKEEKLRGRHRDTHAALQWLRKNRQLFEGNVYEPMMLVVNVKNPDFAKYVENHISFHDLRAFVFQRKNDMEKFMTELAKLNLFEYQRFGFFTYLREMFDAPDEVMSYLCFQYKVHDVPVGNNQTKALIKTVCSCFYSHPTLYKFKEIWGKIISVPK